MRRRTPLALGALLLALALGGCGDEEQFAADTPAKTPEFTLPQAKQTPAKTAPQTTTDQAATTQPPATTAPATPAPAETPPAVPPEPTGGAGLDAEFCKQNPGAC